jgi:hypothetical protein
MSDPQNIIVPMESAEEPVDSIDSETENLYDNCKIYCLWCDDECYYIGVTRTELRYRLSHHKQDSKKFVTRRLYKHINQIGWDNVEIECLETFSCNSRKEMLEKETEYLKAVLEDSYCLNNNISFQTEEELKERQAQYRAEHRDKILEYKKKYRQNKVEEIRAYNKSYVEHNVDAVKERRKRYIEANKEKLALQMKKYSEQNKDKIAEYKKKYREEHINEIKQKEKAFRELHKEEHNQRAKEYYSNNKEECSKRMKEYREKNLAELNQKAKQWRAKKKQENPEVSQQCDVCGGTYLPHHKNRHVGSKKHQSALQSAT